MQLLSLAVIHHPLLPSRLETHVFDHLVPLARPQMTLATRDFMMLRWRQFMVMSLALAGTFWWLRTTYKDQVVSNCSGGGGGYGVGIEAVETRGMEVRERRGVLSSGRYTGPWSVGCEEAAGLDGPGPRREHGAVVQVCAAGAEPGCAGGVHLLWSLQLQTTCQFLTLNSRYRTVAKITTDFSPSSLLPLLPPPSADCGAALHPHVPLLQGGAQLHEPRRAPHRLRVDVPVR